MAEEVTEKLKLRIHTTLYNNFFLLRIRVVINEQQAIVECGAERWLKLNCRYPQVGVTFDSLVRDVNEVLHRHGVEGVTNYWCEEMPLFELKVLSKDDLKKLLNSEKKIKTELASRIAAHMIAELQTPDCSAPLPSLNVRVEPQVLLLIPNHATNDAKIIQVTRYNITSCMDLFRESEVFNFGALFRAFRTNPSMEDKGPENIQQLVCELSQVAGWYHLGLHLGVREHQLEIIATDHPQNTVRCRTEMLSCWMKNTVEKKWATVVQALVTIGEKVLACKIALKYGVPCPNVSQEKKLHAVIHETCPGCCSPSQYGACIERFDIEGQDQKLQQQDQSLKQAVWKRMSIAEKFTALGEMVLETKSRIKQLLQNKKELETTLELREHEFQLLSQQSSRKEEKQQQFLLLQAKEIADLKEKLAALRDELEERNPQLSAAEKELRKVMVELAEKSTEIQKLREEKEATKSVQERNIKRIDDLLMQHAEINYGRKVEVHHQKEEAERKSKEMKVLQETLEKKDEKIKALLELIMTQEAKLQQLLTLVLRETMDDHQLKYCMDAWKNLSRSEVCMQDAEEECSTHMNLDKEDGSKPHTSYTELSLKWDIRKRAPQGMYRGAAVACGNTIYAIGFGHHQVYSYKLDTNIWKQDEVSPCPHTKPGLVMINNLLTAVGGLERNRLTNKLVSWKQGKWVKVYPPMHTPRKEPGLVSTDTHIVAVGGDRIGKEVEAFHIPSRVWSTVTSLPIPLPYITATLCHGDIIAVGRYGAAYTVSTDALISKPTQWTSLPNCQQWSTLTNFHGRTLLVHFRGIYELQERKWVRIGDMLVPKALPIVCAADDHIVVVGGCDRLLPPSISGLGLNTSTSTVRVATIV